ncbi:hypothetical protein GCM10010971_21870 [Silvimonas amylolytica]|uniref:Secreted protein n=1 Tax=Silvimonas amylolytica TaxID=449663 RepID=A0ABQ2PL67_9NEIS|nr:hypothetical protein GCM10010971_21870 [Silvimonas amylolytica]
MATTKPASWLVQKKATSVAFFSSGLLLLRLPGASADLVLQHLHDPKYNDGTDDRHDDADGVDW